MKGAPDRLAGGSLCDLPLRGGLIHKRYAGPIERGHEKLIREQAWFEMVPIALRNTGSPLFPSTSLQLGGRGRRRTTTLLVETLDRETMTKAILAGRVDRRRAAGWWRRKGGMSRSAESAVTISASARLIEPSSAGNPVAMIVSLTSFSIFMSVTMPKMMLASGSTTWEITSDAW